jgi:hypothetical protein
VNYKSVAWRMVGPPEVSIVLQHESDPGRDVR